jgi:hypothetical protein
MTALPFFPIVVRKVILQCCRAQRLPVTSETGVPVPQDAIFRHIDKEHWNYPVHSDLVHPHSLTLLEFLLSFQDLFSNAFYSGLISMLVRNTFYSGVVAVNSIRETRMASIHKELLAALTIYHPTTFNWHEIMFHPHNPIHPTYPYEFTHYRRLNLAFIKMEKDLTWRTLFPKCSSKTLGQEATENFQRVVSTLHMNAEEQSLFEATTAGLEALYARFGVRIDGSTEVRSSWRYNDLTPRVYYAQGPDQYYTARYVQEIFNIMVDAFPPVNRIFRHSLQGLVSRDTSQVFIYDYSSFTSTLHELYNFVMALAERFRFTKCLVVDSHNGVDETTIGKLLLDFAETCCKAPTFDAARVAEDLNEEEHSGPVPLTHNTGMLGVPGNIQSCTLLHGFHLSCLLLLLEAMRCVGDDAIAAPETACERQVVVEGLRNIGQISMPKTHWWDPSEEEPALFDHPEAASWIYVKRPLNFVGGQLFWNPAIIFPPSALIFNAKDPHHFDHVTDEHDKVKRAIRLLTSFAIQFTPFESNYSEGVIDLCNQWLRLSIQCLNDKLVQTHIDPKLQKFWKDRKQTIPLSVGTKGVEDVRWILKNRMKSFRVPSSFSLEEDKVWVKGWTHENCRMSRYISLAVKIGFASSEMEYRECSPQCDEDVDIFISCLTRQWKVPASYTVVVYSDCPDWLFSCIQFPHEDHLDQGVVYPGDELLDYDDYEICIQDLMDLAVL